MTRGNLLSMKLAPEVNHTSVEKKGNCSLSYRSNTEQIHRPLGRDKMDFCFHGIVVRSQIVSIP